MTTLPSDAPRPQVAGARHAELCALHNARQRLFAIEESRTAIGGPIIHDENVGTV